MRPIGRQSQTMNLAERLVGYLWGPRLDSSPGHSLGMNQERQPLASN